MVIYVVSLYTQHLRYNICNAWFIDIRLSTCMHPARKVSFLVQDLQELM